MGKRLGAISKETRERNARMRQLESMMSYSGIAIVIAAVGVLGYIHYFKRQQKDTVAEEKENPVAKTVAEPVVGSNKIPKLETL